jgi:hypothetical protein
VSKTGQVAAFCWRTALAHCSDALQERLKSTAALDRVRASVIHCQATQSVGWTQPLEQEYNGWRAQ